MSALRNVVLSAGALALVAACSEPTTPPSGPELILGAASPTSTVAQAGSLITDYPAVIVRDASGNPVPDVSVTFRVSGGGFLAGSTPRTNAAGIAKPLSWRVSTVPGQSTVTASIDRGAGIVFEVQAMAGPPAQVTKVTGDRQVALRETALPVRPTVRVGDMFGNPIAGANVTFSVVNGGGSITGADAVSDESGIARLAGWTLGTTGGQSIKATVGSIAVFFTANVRPELLRCLQNHVIGPSITSELDAHGNCQTQDEHYFEAWNVDVATSGWEFRLESEAFDPLLELRDLDGQIIAINDNENPLVTTSRARVILPAGRYAVVATTALPDKLGVYKLSHSRTTTAADCGDLFITRGVVLLQDMSAKACTSGTGPYYDQYRIYVQAYSTIQVSIQDQIDASLVLEILDADGKVLMTGTPVGPFGQKVVFEAPADGFYTIKVSSGYYELVRYSLGVQ